MNQKALIGIVVLLLVVGAGYMFFKGSSSQSMPNIPDSVSPTAAATSNMTPSDNIYKKKTDASKGAYMTDFQGMTLYTFDKDTLGVSNCSGGCLVEWPVYTSGATAQGQFPENITVITRKDGSKQFAWKGMPLYYYQKDTKAGDITGDGVGGIWHIIKL